MFTGPVGPVEVLFYWPKAILGNFYWPGAIGPMLASSPGLWKWLSPDTPVSSTTYNWVVTTYPEYGRKSDEISKFCLNR